MYKYLKNKYISSENKFHSLIVDSGLYVFFNVIERGIAFLMLPLIIRLVSPVEYGKYTLFLTLESLLMPIVTLNIYGSISKDFFDDGISMPKYNPAILFSLPLFSLLFIIVSLFLPLDYFSQYNFGHSVITPAIYTSCLNAVIVYAATYFRLIKKPQIYGLYSILQASFLFVLLIFFANNKASTNSLILAKVIHVSVIFIVTILFLYYRKELVFKFDYSLFRKALVLSLPTVIYSISAFVFVMSDRLLINYFYGPKEVGFYAGINQITAIISIFTAAFNAAWMPWLFENLKKNSESINAMIVKVSYLLMLVFIVLGIIFGIAFPFIAKLVLTPDFNQYFNIASPLIFGMAFQGIYLLVSPYVYYAGKTKYHAIIGVISALINLGLNILIIPKYSILGASYTTLLTWMILTALFFYASNKVHPMPWLKPFKKEN